LLSGVGHQGRTSDELVAELREAGVDLVVDARFHAVGRVALLCGERATPNVT
jgi:hypothetical protein